MVTIKEVSELAGVSQATVSRVINGTGLVTEKTQRRVQRAMKTLGYRPNSFARALASNRSGTIGLVIPELSGPFFGDLMFHVEASVRRAGLHLVLTPGGDSQETEQEAIEYLLGRKVDGLVLGVEHVSDDYLISLTTQGQQLALINRYLPELEQRCVYLDDEAGGHIACEHLISNGHRDIACISGPLSKYDARGRLLGYRMALEQHGLRYQENLVVEGDYLEQGGVLAMEKLLARKQRFTAVFCCNDHMAFGAIQTLQRHGLEVPGDVSVIGFDNVSFARYLTPGLTTINFPVGAMGELCANLLIQALKQNPFAPELKLLPSLVERASVSVCKDESPIRI